MNNHFIKIFIDLFMRFTYEHDRATYVEIKINKF